MNKTIAKQRLLRRPEAGLLAMAKKGSVLCFVLVALMILTIFGFGTLTVAYGLRHRAIAVKKELSARYAAEAGFEKALYDMGQKVLPYELDQINSGNISFTGGNCNYNISWVPPNPETYRITSKGHRGDFVHTVSVLVEQDPGFGNAIGASIVPSGPSTTSPVYFKTGEIIDMPIHINCKDEPDDSDRDIYISGTPSFRQKVSMGESRYSAGGSDKYSGVMNLFHDGIFFDQPDNKITDATILDKKINYFRYILFQQKPELVFAPVKNNNVTNGQAAVQLEFYVDANNVGMVRITNNCTVRGYKESSGSNTWDYRIDPDSGGTAYEQYYIYGYHYIPNAQRVRRSMDSIMITPSYGGVDGQPEGRIYVDGNVIIGSKEEAADELGISTNNLNKLKGQVTVVVTKNIWVANDVMLDGPHDAIGRPANNNPNVLGVVAKGVVKVIDPGKTEDLGGPASVSAAVYEPIGIRDTLEICNTGANGYHEIYSSYWAAQTYEASRDYKITSVKLLLYKTSGTTGTIEVSIRRTYNNEPTGSDISGVVATSNSTTLPTGSPYEWREFFFSSPISLDEGERYAIVVRKRNGSGRLRWRLDNTSPAYSDGRKCRSTSSGSSWSGDSYEDFMFETCCNYLRHMNRDTEVEAAITVAGGGWGAENVRRSTNDRKDWPDYEDKLYVRGSICEATRGVVGVFNQSTGVTTDGYVKRYYLDERLTNGTIRVPGGFGPGGLSGEFVPVPGGWREFSGLDN